MSGNLLTLDLGNSTLTAGWWRGEKLLRVWSLTVGRKDFFVVLARRLKADRKRLKASTAILSSVVPGLTGKVSSVCRKVVGSPPLILDYRVSTGMKILYRRPERVGADRIAAAVGVWHFYGGPAIVIDFGTAITFDVVSRNFEYLGGVIAPGLGIATDALFQRAALLPRVKIAMPKQVLGRDTVAAIQSGVYFGTLGLVERIVRELKRELAWKGRVNIVATGGQAELIAARCPLINHTDPFLVLKGLRIVAEGLVSKQAPPRKMS